ncbi:MAG: HlyD family efflux transporter periplasmic adaptor subunit [Motiliproteus sp.]
MKSLDLLISFVSRLTLTIGIMLCSTSVALAHGGEEHSHETPPSPAIAPIVSNQDKMIAATDSLELVAVAAENSLLIYLDHFETNRPAVKANIVVETNSEEFTATEIQPGLYQLDAEWVGKPGIHELLITVDSEELSDLIDGSLSISLPASNDNRQLVTMTASMDRMPQFDSWQLGVAFVTTLLVLLILLKVRSGRSAAAVIFALVMASPADQAMAHGDEDHSADSNPKSYSTETIASDDKARRLPSGEVYLPKAGQRTLSIRTQLSVLEQVATNYQLTAHVVASPNHSGQVQAALNGRVDTSKIPLPHLGQWVEQGELVGHILPIAERFEQGNQRVQQAELSSALRLAETRYTRLVKLKGSVPQKEIDEAKNEIGSLKARLNAVVKSLRGREPLYAPIAGYITSVEVTPGQVVGSQDTLLQIVNPRRMQVEALAYERQATVLEKAYGISRANEHLDLKLLGVGVNLKGHAIPMLFEVEADDPPLAIGEAVSVYVSGKQRTAGILVPRTSLVKSSQGEDLVWTHPAPERFSPRSVRWSVVDKEHIAVTEGLKDGERVVIQGATLLSQIR